MYCGVRTLFPYEYSWVANSLKVKNSSQWVPVRIHVRVPRIDFILFFTSNFCVIHIFFVVLLLKNKVSSIQSGVLIHTLHYTCLFVSVHHMQDSVLYRYFGERKNYRTQSISSQIYHVVKDMTTHETIMQVSGRYMEMILGIQNT